MPTPPFPLRLSFCTLLVGLLAAACSSSPSGSGTGRLVGTVYDDRAGALVGARVALSDGSVATQSTKDGSFNLALPDGTASSVTVVAEDATHARVQRVVTLGSGTVSLVLHAYDLIAPVTLPAAGEAPVTATVTNPNGFASLTLAAGNLVDAAGQPAVGPAEVRMAYWTGNDDHIGAPSILWGLEADGSFNKLDSFGMTDFVVYQNGNALRVASGQNVLLSMGADAADFAAYARPDAIRPNIYRVDPDAGLWSFAGQLVLPQAKPQAPEAQKMGRHLARDNVRGVMENGVWKVYVNGDHAWNIDQGLQLSMGGCVTGRTVDACTGQPVAKTAFTHYLLGIEEVAGFEGLSDSAGTFCTAMPFSTWSPSASQTTAAIKYIVTKKDDASQTAYCNPAAKFPRCFVPPAKIGGQASLEPGRTNYVADCRLGKTDQQADQGIPMVRYQDTCVPSAAALSVRPCTFCSAANAPARCTANSASYTVEQAAANGSCTNLKDVRVPTPTCICDNNGKCTPLCTTEHTVGSACFVDPESVQNADKFIACCDKKGRFKAGELQCGDNVCILTSALQKP